MKPTTTLTSSIFKNVLTKNSRFLFSTNKKVSNQIKMFKIRNSLIKKQSRQVSCSYLSKRNSFFFSEDKKGPLKAQDIPAENLQVVQTQQKVDNQDIQVFHTKGTLSILDKVPGVKNHESGDLYVLMFTCGQCNTKQVKSFTKNAYHKGVVLARCIGCDKVHLVADNLGWFEDQPTNVQTLHKDKVKKVHDHAAINAFLQKAFSQEQLLLKNQPQKTETTEQNTEKKE